MCLQAYCELNPSNQAKSGESIVASSRQDVPTDARPYFKQIPSSFAKNPIENGTLIKGHISKGCLCKRRLAKENIIHVRYLPSSNQKKCVLIGETPHCIHRQSGLNMVTKVHQHFILIAQARKSSYPPSEALGFAIKKANRKTPGEKSKTRSGFFFVLRLTTPEGAEISGFVFTYRDGATGMHIWLRLAGDHQWENQQQQMASSSSCFSPMRC